MSNSDVTILCLPDSSAKEAVIISKDTNTRILDASSAHRTDANWTYGFAELNSSQREIINNSKFVANPGCYATGAIALLSPLIQSNLLTKEIPISINAVSGFSGGGSKMIEKYENGHSPSNFYPYGLALDHKHIPEIMKWSGMTKRPIFQPSVGNFKQGMLVFIPSNMPLDSSKANSILRKNYEQSSFIKVIDLDGVSMSEINLNPEALNNTNNMELFVINNDNLEQAILISRLDNLGKGASGAAVQNLNIMLDLDEGICVNL